MTQPTIRLTVNGRIHDVNAAPDTALLYVLRNDLELNGPKYGCGLGECGACAVLIDGVAARSCVIPISGCVGRDIVTLEGLGSRDHPDPVQDAFIREQAAQCGYCLNGMIMTTKALLMRTPHPSEADVLEALRYNLCRCGAHIEIMRAAMRAAGHVAEAQGLMAAPDFPINPELRPGSLSVVRPAGFRRRSRVRNLHQDNGRRFGHRLQRPCRSRNRHSHRARTDRRRRTRRVLCARRRGAGRYLARSQSGRDHRQRDHPDHGGALAQGGGTGAAFPARARRGTARTARGRPRDRRRPDPRPR